MSLSYDPRDAAGQTSLLPDAITQRHGTAVSGLIGASLENHSGLVGVVHDATLSGYYIRFGSGGSSRAEIADLLMRQSNVDVSNNSWILQSMFSDNFAIAAYSGVAQAIVHVATNGRDGLGTSLVFAAGNDRQYVAGSLENDGDNTNYHNFTNSRRVITVGGTDTAGNVTSFSTPGASILVSAPSVGILVAAADDGDTDLTDNYFSVSGTSFAAPIVTGVIALMLEANPNLGYRDVQDIIALSSRKVSHTAAHWQENGSGTWNGGGNYFSHDVGFGLVDAAAAVALAESWVGSRTASNEASLDAVGIVPAGSTLQQGTQVVSTFSVAPGVTALTTSWVEININITHTAIGDLKIILRSPSGVESVLVNRPGGGASIRDDIVFTLTSNAYRGETATGAWVLIVEDQGTLGTGTFAGASMRLYGDLASDNVQHVFTDDFAAIGNAPLVLNGSMGSADEINLAAVSGDIEASLITGSEIDIHGRLLRIGIGESFENLSSGSGNDVLSGNDVANRIFGGRGNDLIDGKAGNDTLLGDKGNDELLGDAGDDTLDGGDGDDTLNGGVGVNTIDGGSGQDIAIFSGDFSNFVVTTSNDVVSVAGNTRFDQLTNVEVFRFSDRDVLLSEIVNLNSPPDPSADESGFTWFVASHHNGDNLQNMRSLGFRAAYGGNGNDVFNASNNLQRVVLYGNGGADSLIGGHGNDYLYTDADDILVEGGAGFDYALVADSRDTTVNMQAQGIEGAYGGNGNDTLDGRGSTVNVAIWGNAGADRLFGGSGNDYIYIDAADIEYNGGAGHDYLLVWDTIGVSANLTALGFEGGYGGLGNDQFDASAASTSVSLWGNGGADQLIAGAGNDYLYVDAQDNLINGGAGYDWAIVNDTHGVTLLLANALIEGVAGGAGNDSFDASGSNSAVRMFGGAGNDTLIAGIGNDELRGDAGLDQFVFSAGSLRANGQDFITDFSVGEDRIEISGIAAGSVSVVQSSYGSSINIALDAGGLHKIVLAGVTPAQMADQIFFI